MHLALVCTDLDGTFLGEGGHPHPGNMAAARELHRRGVHFVVATGRPWRWLHPLEDLIDIDPIVITSNGAVTGRLSREEPDVVHPLDHDAMVSFVDALPDELRPLFAVEYPLGWGREHDYPPGDIRAEGGAIAPVAELLAGGDVVKLLVHTRHATTEQLAEAALAAAGDRLTCTFSWSDEHGTVEVSGQGVSKGSALRDVLNQLGVDPSHCAAFGDMPNDLEMLKLVGRPFLVEHHHPSLDQYGFPVIGHHADGAVGTRISELLD